MTDYLRFLFTPADRDRIDPNSISVDVTPFDPAPTNADARWPESLRLRFRVQDPEHGAPQLRMIFPGEIRYAPNPLTGAQVLPTTDSIDFNGSNVEVSSFNTWPNRGDVRIFANARTVTDDLAKDNKLDGIGRQPTVAWFGPVEITRDFINDTVLNGLDRRVLATTPPLTGADAGWPAEAVTQFYAGRYMPLLRPHQPPTGTPVDRNLDDVIRFPMPCVVMDAATGQVDLTITMAIPRSGAERAVFPGTNPHNVNQYHPGHPTFEIIPTRVFFQQERTELIGATAGNAVADTVIAADTFVRDRKTELQTLGFGDLGPADNTYPRRAKWAVREFQIYSKMANVATEPAGAAGEYAQRLNQVANGLVYDGPINGYLNAMTRERMDFWLRNRYRCPVVVTARTGAGFQNLAPNGENLWTHDQLTSEDPRMFVRDLSGHYPLPAADARDIQVGGNRQIVLGFYKNRAQGGPNMMASRHSWASMGLDSTHMTGVAENAMANQPAHAAMWSTYLTILPTIEEEAALRFDVVNAWDSNATISVPYFHYNLHAGELGGLLAFISHSVPATFRTAVEFFGAKPEKTWPNTHNLQAKRTSKLQIVRQPGYTFENLPNTQAEENYFKTWHWFYRFVMAIRVFDDWKRAAYDFARVRVQDLRATRMTDRPAGNTAVIPQDNGGNNVTIGQVFTSEMAMGLLLRWQVYRPGHVAAGGANPNAGERLWNALARAQNPAQNGGINVNWGGDVAAWTNDHEAALIAGVDAEGSSVSTGLQDGFNGIQAFTRQGHNLSSNRNSFRFDAP